jgi:hypothetical protein
MVVGWVVWEIIAGTWQLNISGVSVYLVAGWFYARDARKERDLEGRKRLNR